MMPSQAYLRALAKLENQGGTKETWVRRGTICRKCQTAYVPHESAEGEPDVCGLCKAKAKRLTVQ